LTRKREGRPTPSPSRPRSSSSPLSLVVAFLYNDHVAKARRSTSRPATFYRPRSPRYDVAIDGISLLMVVLTALTVCWRARRARPAPGAGLRGVAVAAHVLHDGSSSPRPPRVSSSSNSPSIPLLLHHQSVGGKERSKAALKSSSTPLPLGVLAESASCTSPSRTSTSSPLALTSPIARLATAMSTARGVALIASHRLRVKAPIWPLHSGRR